MFPSGFEGRNTALPGHTDIDIATENVFTGHKKGQRELTNQHEM